MGVSYTENQNQKNKRKIRRAPLIQKFQNSLWLQKYDKTSPNYKLKTQKLTVFRF